MTLRMRQICLVARRLQPVVDAFQDVLGLSVCFRDPGVATYGLENALFPVGDGFLEVVAPVTDGTAAGRFLERRGGDGGYMVIAQCADVEARRRRCAAVGVRVAHEIVHDGYHELQLHPRDVGAAMLSFAWQAGGEAAGGPWHPAGPGACAGPARSATAIAGATPGVSAMVAAELQGDDPERLAARWSEVLELPRGRDAAGQPVIDLDDARLRFVAAADGRGEGLAGLDLRCAEPAAVLARARVRGLPVPVDRIVVGCGMRLTLV